MPIPADIGQSISQLDPNIHTRLLNNQLGPVYDAGLSGAYVTASVSSTGQAYPAEGALTAVPDSDGTRWLLGALSRWEDYPPGHAGPFRGHYVPAGGLQIKVEDGSFNIEFPKQESVQGLVMGTTIIGNAEGTQYVISVSSFWLH